MIPCTHLEAHGEGHVFSLVRNTDLIMPSTKETTFLKTVDIVPTIPINAHILVVIRKVLQQLTVSSPGQIIVTCMVALIHTLIALLQ